MSCATNTKEHRTAWFSLIIPRGWLQTYWTHVETDVYLGSLENSASSSCVLLSPPAFIAQSVLISSIYLLITHFLPCITSHSPLDYPLTWACFDHSHYKKILLEPSVSLHLLSILQLFGHNLYSFYLGLLCLCGSFSLQMKMFSPEYLIILP